MSRCVALARTDVSEERIASIIRVARIGELETTLAITSNRIRGVLRLLLIANNVSSSLILVILMMEVILPSEASVQEPHGVTSQKTVLFIVPAVKTSNLT
jgi:hypothetical protein